MKGKLSSQSRNESLLKANDSASLTRFLQIHDSPEPYILYHIIRETPKLYKNGKLAVRLFLFIYLFFVCVVCMWLFSGDYTMICRSCGVTTSKLTEHLILFYNDNETFYTKL